MRGPYQRLKFEFRRTFECPECNNQLRVEGTASNMLCPCQASKPPLEAVWMRMISEGDSMRPWVWKPAPEPSTNASVQAEGEAAAGVPAAGDDSESD